MGTKGVERERSWWLGPLVIAVPRGGGADAIRRLGAEPRVLFPVVTEGATDIVGAYRLFDDAPHVEVLIDRQGYLRALRRPTGAAAEMSRLLADLQTLAEEAVTLPPADEHVH